MVEIGAARVVQTESVHIDDRDEVGVELASQFARVIEPSAVFVDPSGDVVRIHDLHTMQFETA